MYGNREISYHPGRKTLRSTGGLVRSLYFLPNLGFMIFEETQQFRQWWLWVIILVATLSPLAALFYIPGGLTWEALISPGIGLVVGVMLFFGLRLKTKVDENGIYYRFFPFHLKTRFKSWEDIEYAYVRKYSPLGEYGGWGIRLTFGNGLALNVSGNMGLQIKYKNGKKLLIGTNKATELEALMQMLYENGLVRAENENAGVKDRF